MLEVFSGIGNEIRLFRDSLIIGAGLVATYDFLRVLRRGIIHGVVWVSVEDFLYWLTVFSLLFIRVSGENNGIIRFYMILGIGIGALIYYYFCSRFIIRFVSKLIYGIKKQLKKAHEVAKIKLEKLRELRKNK